MKSIIVFLMIITSGNILAAKKDNKAEAQLKTEEQQKVYEVKSDSTQLDFGSELFLKQTPFEHWYFSISRGGINYELPSLVKLASDFSNKSVGLTLGKKQSNSWFNISGLFEYSFEWQNFERTANNSSNYLYSQKLNILKLNFYQNYTIVSAFQKSLFVSLGAGLSPMISTLDQSPISNSSTDLGVMGTIKTNIIYPFQSKTFFKYSAIDLELSAGLGVMGGHNITATTIKLGSNFDW